MPAGSDAVGHLPDSWKLTSPLTRPGPQNDAHVARQGLRSKQICFGRQGYGPGAGGGYPSRFRAFQSKPAAVAALHFNWKARRHEGAAGHDGGQRRGTTSRRRQPFGDRDHANTSP